MKYFCVFYFLVSADISYQIPAVFNSGIRNDICYEEFFLYICDMFTYHHTDSFEVGFVGLNDTVAIAKEDYKFGYL